VVKSPNSSIPSSQGHKKDGTEREHERSHPLRRSGGLAEHFADAAKKRAHAEELIIEKIEEWQEVLNRLASSPDGQIFLKMMLRANNLFTPGTSRDTVKAVEDKQRQDFYLRHVRPYIDKSLRAEFE
jgi:hypothetical protein